MRDPQDDLEVITRTAMMRSFGLPVHAGRPDRPDRAELERKAANIARIAARRRRIERIRETLAAVEGELEHGIAQHRRASVGGGENSREAALLPEIVELRAEFEMLMMEDRV